MVGELLIDLWLGWLWLSRMLGRERGDDGPRRGEAAGRHGGAGASQGDCKDCKVAGGK